VLLKNGNVEFQEWKDINGKYHSIDDIPAIKYYNQTGERCHEIWMHHGKLHRDGNPAVISYHDNGKIHTEEWFRHGLGHNEHGVADCVHDKYGNLLDATWYLDGSFFYDSVTYMNAIQLANDIRKNINLAILYMKHELKFIRRVCKEVLDGK
jgi:hypothetical protein